MSKYIDADELLKEASKDGAYGYVSAEQIANFPTADVEEVVRCRDCEYWSNSFTLNGRRRCLNTSICTDGDFYCGWGSKAKMDADDNYCDDENCEIYQRDLNCERCTK